MANLEIKCRGCGTELDPGAISCPICGRPRTRGEMLRDLQGSRDAQAAARRRPKVLIVLALAGLAAYQGRDQIKRLINKPAATAAAPTPAPPASAATASAPPPPPPAPTPLQPAPPGVPGTTPVNPLDNPPAPSRPGVDPGDPDAIVPPGFAEIFGSVYDLFELKPIGAAFLEFENIETGDKTMTRTGAKGRYRLALAHSAKGFRLKIRKKGYRDDYLEEGVPPLKSWSLARREQAAYEAAQGVTLHVPITVENETRRARYDVVLIPKE